MYNRQAPSKKKVELKNTFDFFSLMKKKGLTSKLA